MSQIEFYHRSKDSRIGRLRNQRLSRPGSVKPPARIAHQREITTFRYDLIPFRLLTVSERGAHRSETNDDEMNALNRIRDGQDSGWLDHDLSRPSCPFLHFRGCHHADAQAILIERCDA